MKEFFMTYWPVIVSVAVSLLSGLIAIITKRKKPDEMITTLIYRVLPDLINQAETLIGPGNGQEKLNLVVDSTIKYLSYSFGLSYESCTKYSDLIKKTTEIILSTPHSNKEVK